MHGHGPAGVALLLLLVASASTAVGAYGGGQGAAARTKMAGVRPHAAAAAAASVTLTRQVEDDLGAGGHIGQGALDRNNPGLCKSKGTCAAKGNPYTDKKAGRGCQPIYGCNPGTTLRIKVA